ncbi:hypothetical protein G6O67_003466 [Ophiocordyceps sinensis]|uniref:Uncharacterized protein n=1 Tax=Ophiocordyceps sinensis TaxID=72228 RepID=A0A8H4PWT9_9HYPO|nr:hypothetical protein G6O67_003466 [Ophiocordyceps sinensis]
MLSPWLRQACQFPPYLLRPTHHSPFPLPDIYLLGHLLAVSPEPGLALSTAPPTAPPALGSRIPKCIAAIDKRRQQVQSPCHSPLALISTRPARSPRARHIPFRGYKEFGIPRIR